MVIELGEIVSVLGSFLVFVLLLFIAIRGFSQNGKAHRKNGKKNKLDE